MSMLAPAPFGRVLTAMITPFDADGALDLDGAQKLADWLVRNGSDGLVVNGTTGESPTLSAKESVELFRVVRAAVTVPVIAGTGSNDTAHSITQSQAAAALGVDGLLVVTPYYNRPPQASLADHFRRVAASTDLPIILYDVPGRTGRAIDAETTIELAAVDNIVAIKDAAGDIAAAARVIANTPDGFVLYSGDDIVTLPLLSVGAVGVISVASHWAGLQLTEMIRRFDTGDVAGARELNAALLPSWAFVGMPDAVNPMPVKAVARQLGIPSGDCRPPLAVSPADLDQRAQAVLATLPTVPASATAAEAAMQSAG